MVEHVGAATWDESMKSLKPAGTLVTCGATTGLDGRRSICAFSIRASFLFSAPTWAPWASLHEVLGHVFAGRLKPVVDRTFPLNETRAAHEYMEKSQMFGKIVLNP